MAEPIPGVTSFRREKCCINNLVAPFWLVTKNKEIKRWGRKWEQEAVKQVSYNNKYYSDTLASAHFSKLAYYNDNCVGAIACKLENKEGGGARVYIMTLGVLAPYRGLGIGTKLLTHVPDLCAKQKIGEIYLHVHTNNEDAINFYKKFGFDITETIPNYYTKITPHDCYVVTKYISHTS
ncbi:hypothetical protein Leryth_004849 [Lithospermum erythrorhizon]|nr:hypothetical protein Leryth_004849 [Lithospermum erythrorhizon]